MIPKTLSASSILVSESCMERWKYENFLRTPRLSSQPADIGTSVHYALEHFVKDVYIDKKVGWDDIAHLNAYYQIGYVETFNTTNFDTEAYKDGAALVAKWYDRNKSGLENEVLSCEVKENFMIKTSAGDIPFNYIWDRADRLEEDVYEVVDYKTIRARINPDDLKRKIQPRAYALAAQIKWPKAKRIWVSFDMLRHDAPVGVVFTRDENADTYRYLKRAAERIIATDEDKTVETINDECKWCIRKTTCESLTKSIAGGSPVGLSVDDIARRKLIISSQLMALKYADEELDALLSKQAEMEDTFEFDTENFNVKMTATPRRSVTDAHAVAAIVGPEITRDYGNFTVTSIDQMLKDKRLSTDQQRQIQAYIKTNWSSPRPKVTEKKEFK